MEEKIYKERLDQVNAIIRESQERGKALKPFGDTPLGKVAEYLNSCLEKCFYTAIPEDIRVGNFEFFMCLYKEIGKINIRIKSIAILDLAGVENSILNIDGSDDWTRLDEIDAVIKAFGHISILATGFAASLEHNIDDLISYYLRAMNKIDALFFNQFSYHSKKEK